MSEERQRSRAEERSAARAGSPAVTGGTKAVSRRDRTRLIAMALLGALVTAFALFNLDEVRVNWLIATWQTPLIVVIVLAFLAGVGADRLVQLRARRRRG